MDLFPGDEIYLSLRLYKIVDLQDNYKTIFLDLNHLLRLNYVGERSGLQGIRKDREEVNCPDEPLFKFSVDVIIEAIN